MDAFIIDAAHFVPQSRVRLFIVGKLKDKVQDDRLQIRQYVKQTLLQPSKLINFIYNHPEIDWDINHNLPQLPLLNTSLKEIIEKIAEKSTLWWSKDRVDYLLNQTFERHLSKVSDLKGDGEYHYLTAFRRVRNGKSMAEIRFDGIAGCLRTPKGGSARQILFGLARVKLRLGC